MLFTDKLVRLALEEDIGCGDITTSFLVDHRIKGRGKVFAKQDMVLAGDMVFKRVFQLLSPGVDFIFFAPSGSYINCGDLIAEMKGPFDILLTGERTALNFIQRLSGIATITRSYVEQLKGLKTSLLDTRKTTPGWRCLEKEAVRAGGGLNHRMGLYDAVLIKENHLAVSGGSITKAINRARELKGPHTLVEVEVKDLSELKEAISAGPDIIMLDNMGLEDMKKAVEISAGRVPLEASGNITIERIRDIALTGVDYISVGAVTHSACSVDMSMIIECEG